MTSDWLPGLPDHPCVCECRYAMRPLRTYLVTFRYTAECPCCGTVAGLASRERGELASEVRMRPSEWEWRPIPVPDGA